VTDNTVTVATEMDSECPEIKPVSTTICLSQISYLFTPNSALSTKTESNAEKQKNLLISHLKKASKYHLKKVSKNTLARFLLKQIMLYGYI